MGLLIGPILLVVVGLYIAVAIAIVVAVKQGATQIVLIFLFVGSPFAVAHSYQLSADYKEFEMLCSENKRKNIGQVERVEYLPIPVNYQCTWGLRHIERYGGIECYKKKGGTFEALQYAIGDGWQRDKCERQCNAPYDKALLDCPSGCLVKQSMVVENGVLATRFSNRRAGNGRLSILSTELLRDGETIALSKNYRYEVTEGLWAGVFSSLLGVSVKQQCAEDLRVELTEKFVPAE